MAKDPDISERTNRVEELIEQLDADECSLDEGEELHKAGKQLLDEVRKRLHEGEGEVLEIK